MTRRKRCAPRSSRYSTTCLRTKPLKDTNTLRRSHERLFSFESHFPDTIFSVRVAKQIFDDTIKPPLLPLFTWYVGVRV
jgi:hypothetical protein